MIYEAKHKHNLYKTQDVNHVCQCLLNYRDRPRYLISMHYFLLYKNIKIILQNLLQELLRTFHNNCINEH